MTAAVTFELLDRRVLGGLVFTDPGGRRVLTAVDVRPVESGVRLMTKRAGEIVIVDAPGLTAQTASFEPPKTPPALRSKTVRLDVRPADPGLGARRVSIKLPRNPDPTKPEPVSEPIAVPLLAAPGGSLIGHMAAVYVNVRRADDGRAIEGAVVRLRPEGAHPEVLALSDAAGDALLPALGVPLASPGPGATVRPDIGGAVDAIVDPDLVRFHPPVEVQAARLAAAARRTGFVDPDDVIARLAASATPPVEVRVAPGKTGTATILWIQP